MKKSKKKKKAPRKPIQAYAFIDTNIFLDFYRANNEATIKLLRKLDKVSNRIICTYQVEMEFLKNRQAEFLKTIRESQIDFDASLPAVMGDSKLYSALKSAKKDLKVRRKNINDKANNILKTPSSNDPIFSTLENIFSSKSEHVLTRDMKIRHKIKRLAWRRFVLGYPPRKNKDTSIGDALNWEWFIHISKELSGKFIIVSRDGDYGVAYNNRYFLNDALKAEFRDRVGKKSISYTHKLSDALKLLEVHVTEEEVESEEQQISSLDETDTYSGITLSDRLSHSGISNAMVRVFEQQKAISERLKSVYQPFNNSELTNAMKRIQDMYKKIK